MSKSEENALGGQFGKDSINNGFWGSNNPSEAYRELSTFMLPLPAIPPKFVYDGDFIKLKAIKKLLLPPESDLPDIFGRLDLIGKARTIMDYHHILDICLCTNCRKNIKELLKKRSEYEKSF